MNSKAWFTIIFIARDTERLLQNGGSLKHLINA